jgi:hypothetical protein
MPIIASAGETLLPYALFAPLYCMADVETTSTKQVLSE